MMADPFVAQVRQAISTSRIVAGYPETMSDYLDILAPRVAAAIRAAAAHNAVMPLHEALVALRGTP